MGTELAIASLFLAAVGTGVSYAGAQEQAKTQRTFALINAQSGKAQAEMQSRLAVSQSAFQTEQAKLAQSQGQVNANALREEAGARQRASQINVARQQENQKLFNSMLRARGGATGTVNDTGSPLDILAQSAELEAAENAESVYQSELERRSIMRQAQVEELGADRAGIQGEIYGMEGLARASAYRVQGVQAQLQGIAGAQGARATSIGAFGNLIGDIGGLAYQRAQSLRWT